MSWKRSIDDVRVVCKKDGSVMVLESSHNNKDGILVCPCCDEHINIKVI